MSNGLPSYSPIVLLGAGPAGVALGRELSRRGVEFIILERGRVGDSWERMPHDLKLVSPWKCNWIDRATADRFRPNQQLSRGEFLKYVRAAATDIAPSIVPDCEARSVHADNDEFIIETTRSIIRSSIIVNATGYFANPVLPQIEGEHTTTFSRCHYPGGGEAAMRQIRAVIDSGARPGQDEPSGHDSNRRLVLIVGARLSAGQLALELFDAGARVAISHRQPIRFGVNGWLWPLVYRSFLYAEQVRLKLPGPRPGPVYVPMPGGRLRRLIHSGAIETVPEPIRYAGSSVICADGRILTPDLVVYATGFSPALKHLEPLSLQRCPQTGIPETAGMESVTARNLFFLGLEMLRNVQSRFLRGIRNDAVQLADILEVRSRQPYPSAEAVAGRAR